MPLRNHQRPALTVSLAVPALVLALSAATAAQTPAIPSTAKAKHAVNLTANLRISPQGGAFVGTGRATGTPFGMGRAKVRSTVKSTSPLRTSTTLTVVVAKRGSAVFKGTGRYVGSTFKVTMRAVSGSGAYRGIEGTNLAVTSVSRNGIDRLRMTGTVRYGLAAG